MIDLSLIQYLFIILSMIIVGCWLWIGEELNHIICYAPLAGFGYIPFFDNLLKCTCLFLWTIEVVMYPIFDGRFINFNIPFFTIGIPDFMGLYSVCHSFSRGFLLARKDCMGILNENPYRYPIDVILKRRFLNGSS